MKKLLIAITCASTLGLAASASAETFNFLDNTQTVGGIVPLLGGGSGCLANPGLANVFCGQPLTFTSGALTLQAMGSAPALSSDYQQANLDWSLNLGNRGGLGVSLNEQIDVGDTLTLTFSSPIALLSASFNNSSHAPGLLFGDIVNILLTAPNQIQITYSGPEDRGVYLASLSVAPVPEPSTWALLGVGLLGLGYMARRRTKNA